jgi:class 3 adenylate cyclase
LLAVWLVCLALFVADLWRGTPYPPFLVERPSRLQEAPRIVAFAPGYAGTGGLAVGDRVVAVSGRALVGEGPVGIAAAFATAAPGRPVPVEIERAGERRSLSADAPSYRQYWPRLLSSLAFGAVALALLLRGRASPLVRAFALTHAAAAVFFACSFAGDVWETRLSVGAHVLSLALAAPLGLRSALLFPDGIRPAGWAARVGPWLFASVSLFDASRYYDEPLSRHAGAVGSAILTCAYMLCALGIVTDTYRRAHPTARRQIRWILLGAYLGAAPPLLVGLLAAVSPALQSAVAIAASSLALIPLSQLLGLSRFNLFDVDRLISHAAAYTIGSVLLLAAFVTSTSSLAGPLGRSTGLGMQTSQLLVAFALAVVILPISRHLRGSVDRAFFPERFALEREGAHLLEELSGCEDAKSLLELAAARIVKLLAPATLVVFVRDGEHFEPALASGVAVPEPLDVSDPTVATLEQIRAPLRGSTRGERALLAPFARALLDALAVPCVVPIRRGGGLFAFLCLGRKRSRDVYTATDQTLLAGVAQKLSAELDRLDAAQTLRASETLVERLRGYVGVPLSDRLGRGETPDIGPAQVSVLFLDLRGYSAYAESQPPDRVFSTVNRYTLAVSEAIERHGGTLVEFDGDGMMAVFGAPESLPRKELAAVLAALEVVAAVDALRRSEAGLQGVGVGIATGEAFVGSIRSSGRMFWTALGNTTNRAARLQTLTRELQACLVIDAATHGGAASALAGARRHPETRIRGLQHPETVYSLPLRG